MCGEGGVVECVCVCVECVRSGWGCGVCVGVCKFQSTVTSLQYMVAWLLSHGSLAMKGRLRWRGHA